MLLAFIHTEYYPGIIHLHYITDSLTLHYSLTSHYITESLKLHYSLTLRYITDFHYNSACFVQDGDDEGNVPLFD